MTTQTVLENNKTYQNWILTAFNSSIKFVNTELMLCVINSVQTVSLYQTFFIVINFPGPILNKSQKVEIFI